VFIFGANDPVHFGALPIAMLTLFRVVTGEDWTDVMYIAMNGCDGYSYPEGACTASEAMPVFGAIYFVTFMLLGAMIFLNLFIGVILSGMEEASEEVAADNLAAVQVDSVEPPEATTSAARLAEIAGRLESIRLELETLTQEDGS
jgi:voltage-gated sodium channel